MHDSDKPEWTKCDEKVRNHRTFSMLDYLTQDVGKRKAHKNQCEYSSVYTKNSHHIPPMEKYISINESIEE